MKTLLAIALITSALSALAQAKTQVETSRLNKTNSKSLSLAFQGSEGVGGGDEVGLDFKRSFLKSIEKSKAFAPEFYNELISAGLNELADTVAVIVTEDTLPVKTQDLIQNSVAYNDPRNKRILINRKRWSAIREVTVKEAIALHEYASIKGLERTGFYPLSTKYVNLVGGKTEQLLLNLGVDRLRQVMAEMPDASKSEIIGHLYQTGIAASVNDIPFLSQAQNYWGGCIGFHPSLPKEKPFKLVIAKYFTKVTQQNPNAEDGPLFQNSSADESKLVVENLHRSYVDNINFKIYKGDYYPNMEVLKSSNLSQSILQTATKDEPYSLDSYIETASYYSTLRIRKDNQYLYFEMTGRNKGEVGLEQPYYGYCWKK